MHNHLYHPELVSFMYCWNYGDLYGRVSGRVKAAINTTMSTISICRKNILYMKIVNLEVTIVVTLNVVNSLHRTC